MYKKYIQHTFVYMRHISCVSRKTYKNMQLGCKLGERPQVRHEL